ncbi:histidine kinase [Mucilaginibacter sp. S1162]|uniref:Histidine kinase n=1 Tax=Mucilaginibacter humi TaxID=2732510 RepID=A0ABX1W1R6_9SPHI|nr:sensor histidine kinase [Mucilaginibacter humi]NNU34060.1 histidine kinase [Mucilaginibacter humi]
MLRFYLTLITFNVYSGLPVGVKAMSCLFGTGFIAAFYYVLVNVIWKHILRKKKYLTTFIIIIALLVGYTVADTLTERLILNTCKGCMVSLAKDQPSYYNLVSSDITNIVLKRLISFGTPFSLIFTLFIPLCLKTMLNAYRRNIDSLKLAKENVQLEFNFLKAQLNPHFLFNTMNNIYGLIISGDKGRSADLVSRLSELLRYILYDSNEDSMPLTKEIKLINDYIELKK